MYRFTTYIQLSKTLSVFQRVVIKTVMFSLKITKKYILDIYFSFFLPYCRPNKGSLIREISKTQVLVCWLLVITMPLMDYHQEIKGSGWARQDQRLIAIEVIMSRCVLSG